MSPRPSDTDQRVRITVFVLSGTLVLAYLALFWLPGPLRQGSDECLRLGCREPVSLRTQSYSYTPTTRLALSTSGRLVETNNLHYCPKHELFGEDLPGNRAMRGLAWLLKAFLLSFAISMTANLAVSWAARRRLVPESILRRWRYWLPLCSAVFICGLYWCQMLSASEIDGLAEWIAWVLILPAFGPFPIAYASSALSTKWHTGWASAPGHLQASMVR